MNVYTFSETVREMHAREAADPALFDPAGARPRPLFSTPPVPTF